MGLKFTKMEGLGNDFVVIDASQQTFTYSPQQIQQWADRRYGIGFDQLLVIDNHTSSDVDFNYQIFNADGSRAEQCGNGARCIGQYIFQQQLSSKKILHVQAPKAIIKIWACSNNQIAVSMDIPHFPHSQLPVDISVNHQLLSCHLVNIGNPHAIIVVESFDDLSQFNSIGKQFNQHADFPEGMNVNFIKIIDPHHIALIVYERGVGITPACGSGACASAAIAIKQAWVSSPAIVQQTGGDLVIEWRGDGAPIIMQGPARMIYHGELAQI